MRFNAVKQEPPPNTKVLGDFSRFMAIFDVCNLFPGGKPMTKSIAIIAMTALMSAPLSTLAASPPQKNPSQKSSSQEGRFVKWTTPYVGFHTGLHRMSLDHYSTETGSMTGVRGGWNILVTISGFPLVLGGSIFYDWNEDQTHSCTRPAHCSSINVGSTVYGFDARIGYPFGGKGQFLAYLHGGPSHISLTGGSTTLSDNASSRYGAGFVWATGNSGIRVNVQYTHVEYGAGIANRTANNLTLGVSIGF